MLLIYFLSCISLMAINAAASNYEMKLVQIVILKAMTINILILKNKVDI